MASFKTRDGLCLHYTDTGTGQPLLCLPGLTRCSRDFDFLAPHVADLRMIALDYRGRGRSDYDPDYRNYNVPRETQDVLELLDHLGLDRVTVLGTSRGGLIAMAMAAAHPDRLAGAILNDVGPVVAAAGIARIMDYVGRRSAAKTLDEAAQAMKSVLERDFPGVPLERWRQQAEIQFHVGAEGLDLRYDARLRTALLEQAADGAAPDLWPLFDALRARPLGVLRGANSDILDAGTLAAMLERHPGMITAEVPARGHVPFLDEPEALTVIRRVLDLSA